ncbi:hypothetical protein Cpir12675_002278 [Ceratocystis pirilliformis]|uniref:Uncharacterized protein n=1 Tax=Ceratocystis pirilliformis TaxID=259994 RepID=A0ABR3ZA66_9PEZI
MSSSTHSSNSKWNYEIDISTGSDYGLPKPSDRTQDRLSLDEEDRLAIRLSTTQGKATNTGSISHDYRGVLEMWKAIVFAETEKEHDTAWVILREESDDQRVILLYLYRTYMPLRAQWAHCFIRGYPNFGICVTSGTEASNNNIKSYLLKGMSHLFRLAETSEEMMADQEADFTDRCVQDVTLTKRELVSKGAEGVPTKSNPKPGLIGNCDVDCLVSTELGIPYYHEIYQKLVSGETVSKWEVHQRWHLRESAADSPYWRILDPKIATSIRERLKNTAQPVPEQLAVRVNS